MKIYGHFSYNAVAQKIWVTRMKWSKYEEMWKPILSRLQVQKEKWRRERIENVKRESRMEQILKLWLSSILFYTKFDDVDIKRSFVSFKLVRCFRSKYLWFKKWNKSSCTKPFLVWKWIWWQKYINCVVVVFIHEI